MATPPFEPAPMLAALCRRGVRFVTIGGIAADAHGVGWATYDLDVVIACDEENYAALDAALAELGAVFDTPHRPPIHPDIERLRTARRDGAMFFRTRYGRLDVLKGAGGDTYDTLLPKAVETTVGGHTVRVASLAALARMKRAAGRPKDKERLPLIEAALRERGGQG